MSVSLKESSGKTKESKTLASLRNLAINLRWTWYHGADEIWSALDPELFNRTKNPWVILQTVSKEKLEALLEDKEFCKKIKKLEEMEEKESSTPSWFQTAHPNANLTSVAYFCMEYMLSESLPIYSGGLGNVAGDQLKAASDLGVPVFGVGLLYQQGYFRQAIDLQGNQKVYYPANDPWQLPITPLRGKDGEWIRLRVDLDGFSVWIRAWVVFAGKETLFLLDSNDPANYPMHRTMTSKLYGGREEDRLRQELILGIGGYRLLSMLGISPEVCHLNEGHAAFAILERARIFMEKEHVPFKVALNATRAGNLFTTHTAVPAGFDVYPTELIRKYLKRYAESALKISIDELMALGQPIAPNQVSPFNMAFFALRGSSAVNAVSRLHEKVSKEIFSPLFPRLPIDEVPVDHVTNGVHMPSWDSASSDALYSETCGKKRWLRETETIEKSMQALAPEKIWKMRNESRLELIRYVQERYPEQLAVRGSELSRIESAKTILQEGALTLGFARRFATYKRPNLLLHDKERLLRILQNKSRPVQLIIAGKAHPKDLPGQQLIQEWMQFIDRSAFFNVVFLEDYDLLTTEPLVQGVDIWINTPRRPWEACGTSGMKVLVNGGLNFSVLDGWWDEAFSPDLGFAIPNVPCASLEEQDAHDADCLYRTLEEKIVPLFYERNEQNIPEGFVNMVKESMARLAPLYSSNRSTREYTERFYLPLADKYLRRASHGAALAKSNVAWQEEVRRKWPTMKFSDFQVLQNEATIFRATVDLGEMSAKDIRVELYAEAKDSDAREIHVMELSCEEKKRAVFETRLTIKRSFSDYTPRIRPTLSSITFPIEMGEILWLH